MEYFRHIMLITVLLAVGFASAEGQAVLKFGYHHAETLPTHGGTVAMHVPLSGQYRIFSLHVRGEASYGRETAVYGGWRAKRVDQMISVGAGAGVAAKLWIVRVYIGMTGGIHRFMDTIRYADRDLGPASLASRDSRLPGEPPGSTTRLFVGYEDGFWRYAVRTAGFSIDIGPSVASFVEYRERKLVNWTGETPANPYRSLYAGFSVELF